MIWDYEQLIFKGRSLPRFAPIFASNEPTQAFHTIRIRMDLIILSRALSWHYPTNIPDLLSDLHFIGLTHIWIPKPVQPSGQCAPQKKKKKRISRETHKNKALQLQIQQNSWNYWSPILHILPHKNSGQLWWLLKCYQFVC